MAESTTKAILGDLDPLTKDPKAVEDFSATAAATIAEATTLVAAGRRDEATEALLVVEKRARQASDAISVSMLVCKLMNIQKELSDWPSINQYVVLLSKKRGQLKRAIIDMLQLCMTWIDEAPDHDTKLEFINTLSKVSEGKIFVEVERARILMIYSKMKESLGHTDEAAAILEAVQVETFGAMDRKEKAEYILEQMRLVLLRKDFVRCQVISKKINPKLLEADDLQDIKTRYYEYMILYHLHEDEYLNVAKSYQSIFNTPKVQIDPTTSKSGLECYGLFLILAAFTNEQSDMLSKLAVTEVKKLSELPILHKLINDFLSPTLLPWPLSYEEDIKCHDVFSDTPTYHEGGADRWDTLRTRVLQHNIKTLQKYYTRIRIQRISELLSIDNDEVEQVICDLVISGFLNAKIDRPEGVVYFGGRKTPTMHLDEWGRDIAKILDSIESSCHLVEKENMLQVAKAKRLQAMQREHVSYKQ